MSNKIKINITGGKTKFENIRQGNSSLLNRENTKLFEKIRLLISKEVKDTNDQKLILIKLTELENSVNTEKFSLKYQDFIATTASYMTIVASFIPALTKLV